MRIAIRKPSPSSPSRLSAGTRQSLKKSSPVVEPLIPIFGSIRPTSRPGASASNTKDEIRACPAACINEHQREAVVLPDQPDDISRELGVLVDLGRTRRDPLAREIADQVADLALLLAQRLVGHAAILGMLRSTGPAQLPIDA